MLRVTLHSRAFSARAALTASLTLWMVPHTTTRPFLGPKRPRLSPAGPIVSRLSSPWGRADGSDLLGVSGSDPPAPGPSPLLLCTHHAPAAGQVICLPETLLKLPMVLSVKSNLLTEPTKPTLMAAPMPRSPRPVPQPPSSNTAASFPRRDLRLAGRRLRLAWPSLPMWLAPSHSGFSSNAPLLAPCLSLASRQSLPAVTSHHVRLQHWFCPQNTCCMRAETLFV